MKYISHYDQNTAIKHGSCPTASDISARTTLLKEKGVTASGQSFLPNQGYVQTFEGPELSQAEQNLLCLAILDEPEPVVHYRNAVDPTAALIQEYQAEFLRVKGHAIDVQQDGDQILINGEPMETKMVEKFLATLKTR